MTTTIEEDIAEIKTFLARGGGRGHAQQQFENAVRRLLMKLGDPALSANTRQAQARREGAPG